MKRRRAKDGDSSDEMEEKAATRWPNKKSLVEQRTILGSQASAADGVVSASRSVAVTDVPNPVDVKPTNAALSSLTEIRSQVYGVTNYDAAISKLTGIIALKFLAVPDSSSWDEECEAVIAVLYLYLLQPRGFPSNYAKDITLAFLRRWTGDNEVADFNSIGKFIIRQNAYANFATLLLLLSNHFPSEIEAAYLESTFSWSPSWSRYVVEPPEWLYKDSPRCDLIALRKILYVSAMTLKGKSWRIEMAQEAGDMSSFFMACKYYKTGSYTEALTTIQGIDTEVSDFLKGWILWLKGLCLLHKGKPNIACHIFYKAVEMCNACIPATFNISRCFNILNKEAGELDALSLFAENGEFWKPYCNITFPVALLYLYHPPPENIACSAHFVAAARYLQCQKYDQSVKYFSSLLQKMDGTDLEHTPSKWLRPEDDLPAIPSYQQIVTLTALACFQSGDFDAALHYLSTFEVDDLKRFIFSEDQEEMVMFISFVAAYMFKMKTLHKLNKNEEALQISLRLDEGILSSQVDFIQKGSSEGQTGLEQCLLMIRTELYWTLSLLYKRNDFSPYRALALQTLNRLCDYPRPLPRWDNMSLSSKLLMDCIFLVLDFNLRDVK